MPRRNGVLSSGSLESLRHYHSRWDWHKAIGGVEGNQGKSEGVDLFGKNAWLFIGTTISLMLFIYPVSRAAAQDAVDFLQNSLVGTDIDGLTNIEKIKVNCESIEITANFGASKLGVFIPLNLVEIKHSKSVPPEIIDFNCIAGGGCISMKNLITGDSFYGTGRNKLRMSGFYAQGLGDSIMNALVAHQRNCGGTVTRPF